MYLDTDICTSLGEKNSRNSVWLLTSFLILMLATVLGQPASQLVGTHYLDLGRVWEKNKKS